jgi:signal transduction histidine kinase
VVVPRLIVIKGADEGRQFPLDRQVVGVGRDSSNGVRLHDTEASRKHAEFRKVDVGYCLVDLGSANGTFVNGQPAGEYPLQPGDQIQIGQSVLVYSAGSREASPTSDLADRISMITRQDLELSSAIIKTIGEGEGSRILAQPEQVEGPWLKGALANLAVMYETTQAISHILDVDQLLEKIMDLIFQTIEADRGCIMLREGETGQFEPKAARWRENVDPLTKMDVSRTIMDYVLREKQGILASDATRDERFNAGQSILRYGIGEVICVPMKGRHETVGVLYLDTRSSARELFDRHQTEVKFTPDHLSLAIAIGHQAALAIEESRYHQAMVQSERMAAIGQTIAALSHHIKNILQGLRSGGEIVNRGLSEKDEPMLLQGWKIVEKNQARIYDMVIDMLSFSKDREPTLESTDLNKLVEEVLELAHSRAEEAGITLESRLENAPAKVEVDPEALHRALLNVVCNAIDAVEEHENACVSVGTSQEADGSWVRIEVDDNGPGIEPHLLQNLFKPFHSTKGARGTGLGLAVSRKILREHGGDILVHSQPGKGSKFTLRLPIKNALSLESGITGVDLKPMRPHQPEA